VKKAFSVLGVVIAVVVYCFTIGTFYNGELDSTHKSLQKKDYTTTSISDNFNPVTSQSESSIQTFCSPLPGFKNQSNKFSLILISTEQFIANTFSQYISFSRGFLDRFQKVDIIFPFHYFW